MRILNGVGSNNVRKMEHQLASKQSLELDTVGASVMCGGSLFDGPAELPSGKMKTWLTDIEGVPSEVTCIWPLKELLCSQVKVTVEQFVHRDESSMEKGALHRGKFEFVEAFVDTLAFGNYSHISSLFAASFQST